MANKEAVAEIVDLGKLCTGCKQRLPFARFSTDRSTNTGLNRHCKSCVSISARKWKAANIHKVREANARAYEPRRAPKKRPRIVDFKQVCKGCRVEKHVSEFPKDKSDYLGIGSLCFPCNRAHAKSWRLRNIEKFKTTNKNAHLLRKYGLTRETFDALLSSQGYRCAICRTSLEAYRHTCVDHNHKTGAVRGILCRPCNSGIGQLRDNPKILRAALKYLRDRGGI